MVPVPRNLLTGGELEYEDKGWGEFLYGLAAPMQLIQPERNTTGSTSPPLSLCV